MKYRVLSLLALSALVAVAAFTIAAPETNAQPSTPNLSALLLGSEEVPGPGDPDGFGSAAITINAATDQVCVNIGVLRIEPATMAHIHRGVRGEAGPVVVNFTNLIIPAAALPGLGSSLVRGCVTANSAIVDEILANPQGFYVNVHNQPFPAGAVRGQLR